MVVVRELIVVQVVEVVTHAAGNIAPVLLHRPAHAKAVAPVAVRIEQVHAHVVLEFLGDDGAVLDVGADAAERYEVAVVPLVAVDLHIQVLQHGGELGMGAEHVVGLVEGVHRGLPVAVPLDRHVIHEGHAVKVVGIEMLGDHAQKVAQGFGVRVHAEPDPAAPAIAGQADDGELVAGRALGEGLGVRHMDQLAAQVVFPQVVGAAEGFGVAAGTVGHLVAPVRADVVEGVVLVVLVLGDDDVLVADLGGDVVAGVAQVALPSAHQPDLGP